MQYLNFQIEVSDDFHMYIAQKARSEPNDSRWGKHGF